jgi:hypothetical protein
MCTAASVDDMEKYANLLESVYGGLHLEETEQLPAFLRLLPPAVGL